MMPLPRSWWSALVCIAVLALVFLGVFVIRRSNTLSPYERASATEEAHWRAEIRTYGAKKAYQMFSDSIATLPEIEQHTHAHVFGAALYHEVGHPGMSVCDESFGQGCMHAFVGLAIANEGLTVVDALQTECVTALAPYSYYCQHGIGHGLAMFFGIDDAGLGQALKYCARFETNDPLDGCYTGAYMEYFERNVTVGEDSPRPVENNNYNSVCGEYAGTAGWLCYFSLPRWWHQLYKHQGMEEADIFKRIGLLCQKVPSDMRYVCIEGTGFIIPSADDYDVDATVQLCNAVTDDPLMRVRCRSNAANDFLLKVSVGDALAVCAGLDGQALAYCDAHARTVTQKDLLLSPSATGTPE